MRKIGIIASVAFLATLFIIRKHMKTPEAVLYDYILALHQDSKVDLPDHSFYTQAQKEMFAKLVFIGRCPLCHRFFLKKIVSCPNCQHETPPALEVVSSETFKNFVIACEAFHDALHEKSKIKTLSYSQIMKLYRLKETALYVR